MKPLSHRICKAIILMTAILSCATAAYSTNVIKVGYIEFPPAFFTNSQNKPEGILIDMGKRVLTKAGYEFEFYSYPAKRMALYLAEGRIHLWMGLATLPEFKGTTLIGNSNIMTLELNAYSVTRQPYIHKKEDLKGKHLIILRGYSYGGWIEYLKNPSNTITLTEVDSHEAGFRVLERKNDDYLLDYRYPSDQVLKNSRPENLTYNTVSSFDSRFVVSRKAPDAKQLLDRLEKAYRELYGSKKSQK